jgi:hypothetical protein
MYLTSELKSVIESLTCLEHKQHPVVVFNEDRLKLECCCDTFKVQCFHIIKKITLLSIPKKNKGLDK